MSLITLGKAIAPSAYNTFTYSDANTATVNYRTDAKISLGASTKNLRAKVGWPVGIDPTRPRAAFIVCFLSGWGSSNIDDASSSYIAWAIRMGMIGVIVEVRIDSDAPIDTGISSSLSAQKRAVYAAMYDLSKAIQFFTSDYRKTADYSIEPNWVFLSGSSAGGVTALGTPKLILGRPVAGMVVACSAFGANSALYLDADDYLRNTLGITEAGLTHKTCSFCDPVNDATISPGRITAFQTAANAISGSTVVTTTNGHTGMLGSGDPDVISTFVQAACAAATPAASGLVFA